MIISTIYRRLFPVRLRKSIYDLFLGDTLKFCRTFKGRFLSFWAYRLKFLLKKTEKNQLYIFLGKYGIHPLPYEFRLKYEQLPVDVRRDSKYDLPYVVFPDGKRLFFPRSYSDSEVKRIYRGLYAEQDTESPHYYLHRGIEELKGRVFLDIGAAEGFSSLQFVDWVDRIYLFEYEDEWIEALTATFLPYQDKCEIVKKYVCDSDTESTITLDTFLSDKSSSNLFVKMDIEGAEISALRGADRTLSNGKDIMLSVCTYHNKKDATCIAKIFDAKKINYTFSPGYMFINNSLRKALIKGERL